jgi:N-methylhydantoinase A
VPFGGAGPTHANLLAEEVGIAHIIIPPAAGTFCALGAAAADLRRDFVRSLRRPLDKASAALLNETFKLLQSEGIEWLDQEGEQSTGRLFEKAADMRYVGQAYELRVTLNNVATDPNSLAEAFHREHERIYGFRDTQAEVELGTARLAVIGVTPNIAPPDFAAGTGVPATKGMRPLFHKGAWLDAAVLNRSSFGNGDLITGPAIVEQDDTTTVVLPNWTARCDKSGNLHLERLAK